MQRELTMVGHDWLLPMSLTGCFIDGPVVDQIGNSADSQAVLLGKLDQLGQARHGAVVVHNLADHTRFM
ncbi:hypothetical protein D3C78_1301420 [compost metagenome]